MSDFEPTLETMHVLDPEHTFLSEITLPNGVRVSVSITVPEALHWEDVGEIAEIAQMAASTSRALLVKPQAPF